MRKLISSSSSDSDVSLSSSSCSSVKGSADSADSAADKQVSVKTTAHFQLASSDSDTEPDQDAAMPELTTHVKHEQQPKPKLNKPHTVTTSTVSIKPTSISQSPSKPHHISGTGKFKNKGKTPKPLFSKLLKMKQGTTISTAPTSRCDLCNKTFKTSQGLLRHNKYLHQSTFDTYVCTICFKTYTRLDVIKRHIRNIHLVEPTTDLYSTISEGPRGLSRHPKIWTPPIEATTMNTCNNPKFQVRSAKNYIPPPAHRNIKKPISATISAATFPLPLDLSSNTPTQDESSNIFDDKLVDLSHGGIPVYATPKARKKASLMDITNYLTGPQSLNDDLYLSDGSESKHSSITTLSNSNVDQHLPDPLDLPPLSIDIPPNPEKQPSDSATQTSHNKDTPKT